MLIFFSQLSFLEVGAVFLCLNTTINSVLVRGWPISFSPDMPTARKHMTAPYFYKGIRTQKMGEGGERGTIVNIFSILK